MSSLFGHPAASSNVDIAVNRLRWLGLLALIVYCYWPGLRGGFVFDDDVNILQNEHLRIRSLELSSLWSAAWSGHAGPLSRPVAMLSFALNYYFAGFDAHAFKVTNLVIHLLNVLVVGALAQRLVNGFTRRSREHGGHSSSPPNAWAGWVVAAIWGLHPLNLTGVLYVVQRMTSLSTLFGLLALLIYVHFREQTSFGGRAKKSTLTNLGVGGSVLVCTTLSALSKETGVLFLPLLLWIEICIFKFQWMGKPAVIFGLDARRTTFALIAVTILVVGVFVLPRMIGVANYASRDFSLQERVMTEARVIVFYLRMFLMPRNAELSLYHDDFEISSSLLSPASTFTSMAGLVAISVIAWTLRQRLPVIVFGWGWFLIAHSIESTVFALELVYEHRNYFATIGLLLFIPLMIERLSKSEVRRAFAMLLAAYVGILGFVTHDRSLQWSNNVDWALLEASNHPRSPRATYDLARVYMILRAQTGDDRYGALADEALIKSTQAYLPAVLPFMARIQFAYYRGLKPNPDLIDTVERKLRTDPYYSTNTSILRSMLECQVDRRCDLPDVKALNLFDAALANPRASRRERSELLKLQAQYEINRTRNLDRGVELIRLSTELKNEAPGRIMYAQGLAMQGHYDEALLQLDRAEELDGVGVYHNRIDRERVNIKAAKQNEGE